MRYMFSQKILVQQGESTRALDRQKGKEDKDIQEKGELGRKRRKGGR